MEAATTASDGLRKKKKHDATLAELAGSSAMSSGWVVNIQSLLQHYDPLYFHSLLCPRVTLSWSGSLKRYARNSQHALVCAFARECVVCVVCAEGAVLTVRRAR
jgi:hypothetical protein